MMNQKIKSEEENIEDSQAEVEAQEPPGEAKPANELATKAEEIIDVEEEAKEDDKEMETKEDNEYILKTYEDKKDVRDMDMGMGIVNSK